jgi:hypothetical protein
MKQAPNFREVISCLECVKCKEIDSQKLSYNECKKYKIRVDESHICDDFKDKNGGKDDNKN